VDVNGTANANLVDCDLVLNEKAVMDMLNIPYLGLEIGIYTFSLQDMMGPELVSYNPENGGLDNPVDTTVTFTFNEPIELGPDARAVLYAFGGETAHAFRDNTSIQVHFGADQILAVLPLEEDGINGRSLSINLNSWLTHESLFSVSLMPGCVMDQIENHFGGLPEGTYVFRTDSRTYTDESNSEEEDNYWENPSILVAIIAGLAIILGGVMFGFFLRLRVLNARSHINLLPGNGLEVMESRQISAESITQVPTVASLGLGPVSSRGIRSPNSELTTNSGSPQSYSPRNLKGQLSPIGTGSPRSPRNLKGPLSPSAQGSPRGGPGSPRGLKCPSSPSKSRTKAAWRIDEGLDNSTTDAIIGSTAIESYTSRRNAPPLSANSFVTTSPPASPRSDRAPPLSATTSPAASPRSDRVPILRLAGSKSPRGHRHHDAGTVGFREDVMVEDLA